MGQSGGGSLLSSLMPGEHSSLKSLADKLPHSTQASFLCHTPGGSQKAHSTSLSSCVSEAASSLVLTDGSKWGLFASPHGDGAPQAAQGGWGADLPSSVWVGHKNHILSQVYLI